jgi:hypothetical protein
LAVVVLLLWFATAAAGLTLLRAGTPPPPATAPRPVAPLPVRIGAAPLTAEGKPPPIPHLKVIAPDGGRTLLEFSHPALAITGVACWMMFTFVHYRPLAWIAFATLVVTMLIGLSWLTYNRRAARREPGRGWSFPTRLVWLHGVVAVCSITLTVLVAVTASRG